MERENRRDDAPQHILPGERLHPENAPPRVRPHTRSISRLLQQQAIPKNDEPSSHSEDQSEESDDEIASERVSSQTGTQTPLA